MKTTTLRLPEPLHKAYKFWAIESGKSFNTLMVEALEEKLKRNKGENEYVETKISRSC
jgi:predicted HicB family RNase H-like nuclease